MVAGEARLRILKVVNLYIHERREGDVAVLDLKGRIRISGGTLALHRSIRCLGEEGKTKVLLNLAGVTHIDSTGLGELLSSYITLRNKGGQIKLVHLNGTPSGHNGYHQTPNG